MCHFNSSSCSLLPFLCDSITLNQSDNKATPMTPLSSSTLELTDLNGGDIYPSDFIKVEVHIINNGEAKENNIEVKLILSDYF